MSFERLQEAILTQARVRADEVSREYNTSIEKEETRIKDRAVLLEEEIINAANAEGAAAARKLHQETELSARSSVLTAKQEELAATREAFIEHVISSADKAMIKSLLNLLPSKDGEIVPGEKHKDLVSSAAKSAGYKVSSETISDDGGFVYRDASTEMNLTVRHLAEAVFSRHRAEIAQILFS